MPEYVWIKNVPKSLIKENASQHSMSVMRFREMCVCEGEVDPKTGKAYQKAGRTSDILGVAESELNRTADGHTRASYDGWMTITDIPTECVVNKSHVDFHRHSHTDFPFYDIRIPSDAALHVEYRKSLDAEPEVKEIGPGVLKKMFDLTRFKKEPKQRTVEREGIGVVQEATPARQVEVPDELFF